MTTSLAAPSTPAGMSARRRPPLARLHGSYGLRRRLDAPPTREQTVLVIDDDAMARSWLRLSLRESEFRIVGEATTASEAIGLVECSDPDLLLVDHTLADTPGIDLVRELRRRGVETPAVITATTVQSGLNETADEAGAQGTLLKTGSASELIDALRSIELGAAAFDARHPRRADGPGLSNRERQVLLLVAEGATNSEIASELGIGIETVKTLLKRTFAKLGVQRRVQAVWAARELGLV